jgi:hypothetical protein
MKMSSVEKSQVELRDASLPGYEFGSRGIDLSQDFGIGRCRIMVRNELVCEKKISFLILSDSEIVVNPLPGYD